MLIGLKFLEVWDIHSCGLLYYVPYDIDIHHQKKKKKRAVVGAINMLYWDGSMNGLFVIKMSFS